MSGISIKNFTRQKVAVRQLADAFEKIETDVLPDWDISLVFVGEKRARDLNIRLRGKSYVPNVLSYIVGKKSGEIFICLSEATRQAPAYGLLPTAYFLYLFIHAALHIKGLAHGAKMEKCERNFLTRYVATHSNRN